MFYKKKPLEETKHSFLEEAYPILMFQELKQNWRRAHKKRVLFKLGSTLVGECDMLTTTSTSSTPSTENPDDTNW